MRKDIFINNYYQFGEKIFGPFLYGFVKWLRKKIVSNGDTKIFFFSRDGYIMQKAYQLIEEKEPLNLVQNYVYFSRNSLRRALLWKCKNYEESLKYLSKERFTEFAEIMSYYGLDEGELSGALEKLAIGWNDNLIFEELPGNEKVKKVYDDFKDVIFERSYRQYETLVAYLNQIGMYGNCAIVDIGWHGSMQYYLELLIEMAGLDTTVTGYNVGVNPIGSLKGKTEGYLFNKENLKLRKPVLCFFGVIEKLFQSLEGSTDHYTVDDTKICPVLKPYEYEDDKVIQSYIVELQNGALEYIRKILNCAVTMDNSADSYLRLLEYGKKPNYKETQIFKFFYNVDGGKLYFLPQKKIFNYGLKEFIYAFSNSAWKTGFMKAAFRIPFPYFWIYSLIKR